MLHSNARGSHPAYPVRTFIDDESVSWTTDTLYKPVNFTHPNVYDNIGKWADPEWKNMQVKERFNVGKRITYCHQGARKTLRSANLLVRGKPRNPIGRTGMKGRGLLGKHGPNHAADPIVTRYNPTTGKLEMVAIRRKDTGQLAIPGGMTEGESVPSTLIKEFKEEALRYENNERLKVDILEQVEALFKKGGELVFRGYVDDPRNTDDAWMETQCYHIHIQNAALAKSLPLLGGDDASDAMWINLDDPSLKLYASHKDWVDKVVGKMAHRKRLRSSARSFK